MHIIKIILLLIFCGLFSCARNEKKSSWTSNEYSDVIGGMVNDDSIITKSPVRRTYMPSEEHRNDSILFDEIIKALKEFPVFTTEPYSTKTNFIYKAAIHLLYESEHLTTEEKIDLIHIIKMCEIDQNRALITYTTSRVINSDTIIIEHPELYVPMLGRTSNIEVKIDKELLMSKVPSQYKFLYEEYLKDIEERTYYHSEFLNPRSFYQLGLHQKYDLGLPSSVDEFKEYREKRMIIH